MNKYKILLTGALLFTSVSNAEITDVFCSKEDGSDWYWLHDGNENQVSISGNWGKTYISEYKYFKHFTTTLEHYNKVNKLCKKQYIAQPANNGLNDWYVFRISLSGSNHFIAPGRKAIYGLDHTFLHYSDLGLKQNIQLLHNSLDKVSRLGGYRYSWHPDRAQGHLADKTEYGVIAQEVQVEFPELVKKDNQGYLRVNYSGLIPILLESIKELKARVEILEAEL